MSKHHPILAPQFARYWARELGSSEASLVRLQGGINNCVFRCGEGRHQWVVKGYNSRQAGRRDRMQAEVDFLRYASKVASNYTPRLIHVDHQQHCVILEYLEGDPFSEGVPPTRKAVSEAVLFFRALNQSPEATTEMPQHEAAEAYLCLSEHLANLKDRLALLTADHVGAEIQVDAQRSLATVHELFQRVQEQVQLAIDKDPEIDSLDPRLRCISPGDFGFHNAIACERGIRFFDFEFSGLDDPAKTIIDFCLQPRVPVISESHPLLAALDPTKQEAALKRCCQLKPILIVKWACIILSFLAPSRATEITATSPEVDLLNFGRRRLKTLDAFLKRHDALIA